MELAESPETSILGTKDRSAEIPSGTIVCLGFRTGSCASLQGNVIGNGEESGKKEGVGESHAQVSGQVPLFFFFHAIPKNPNIYVCV